MKKSRTCNVGLREGNIAAKQPIQDSTEEQLLKTVRKSK